MAIFVFMSALLCFVASHHPCNRCDFYMYDVLRDVKNLRRPLLLVACGLPEGRPSGSWDRPDQHAGSMWRVGACQMCGVVVVPSDLLQMLGAVFELTMEDILQGPSMNANLEGISIRRPIKSCASLLLE
jgi:hypothetical protein